MFNNYSNAYLTGLNEQRYAAHSCPDFAPASKAVSRCVLLAKKRSEWGYVKVYCDAFWSFSIGLILIDWCLWIFKEYIIL
jgi:hypothetical protein